mgnify:CR=1 FL=1
MFRAYASALSLFAQYVRQQGITGIRPRLIETTAEKVTLPQRELLEDGVAVRIDVAADGRQVGLDAEAQVPHVLHLDLPAPEVADPRIRRL